jgi:uncharacterized protein YjbJ (UPF0337 family)
MLPAFGIAVRMIVIVGMMRMGVIVRVAHRVSFRFFGFPTVHKTVITNQPNQGTVAAVYDLSLQSSIQRRVLMGSTTDKIKGTANEGIGKAKQGIGEATGSDRMKGEGAAQELKGKGQKTVGDAKEATKDAANKAADAVDKNL